VRGAWDAWAQRLHGPDQSMTWTDVSPGSRKGPLGQCSSIAWGVWLTERGGGTFRLVVVNVAYLQGALEAANLTPSHSHTSTPPSRPSSPAWGGGGGVLRIYGFLLLCTITVGRSSRR